jgi:hypothetical protein
MTEYKDLGVENGWYSYDPPKIPEEYKKCCKENHLLRAIKLNNCYTQFMCDICAIRFEVDSSG